MTSERILQTLVAPHVSEKSAGLADSANQHVFKVAVDADKASVKQAVETLFKVKVAGVQILRVKGKSKRFGRIEGRRNHWKKAYVRLESGYDIEIGQTEAE